MSRRPAPAASSIPGDLPPEAFRLTLAVAFLVTAIRLLVNSNEFYPLHGDEAQYWLWAQSLEFGYYSKPPLVAWLIAATTGLLGDREFAVRLASPLLHLGTSLLIFGIAARLHSRRAGLWASLLYLTLPGVSWSSLLISTDPALLFAWALMLYAVVRATQSGPAGLRWWLLGGVALGIGLLAKYAMLYAVAGLALWLIINRRDLLKSPGPWILLAVGLLILSPNILWNMQNGAVTLAHTADNADLGNGAKFNPAKLGDFLAGQLAVFGPLSFPALVGLLLLRGRRLAAGQTSLLLWLVLPPLVLMTGLSIVTRANANWAAASYVGGSILLAMALVESRFRWVVPVSIALHVAVMGIGYSYHDLARLAGIEIPFEKDPTRRFQGGRVIGRAVANVLNERGQPVLMTDQRLLFAQLAYYARPRRQVQWDGNGRTDNQFEMQAPASSVPDAPILFVTRWENSEAPARYREHERIGSIIVPQGKNQQEVFYLFMLRGLTEPPPRQ